MTYIEKTLTGTINAGTSSITFTDDFITNDSIIDIYFEDDDVVPTEQNQTGNTLIITIETRTTDTDVAVHITNADTLDFEYDIESLNDAVEGIGVEIDNINNDILSIGESITELETEKQDKLTAGTNITISEDNIISASGGGDIGIYDDTERVIGTWFGKPLYRKVVNVNNITIRDYDYTHNIANISKIVHCSGSVIKSSGITLPLPYAHNQNIYAIGIFASTSIIGFRTGTGADLPYSASIILDYTKVGD